MPHSPLLQVFHAQRGDAGGVEELLGLGVVVGLDGDGGAVAVDGETVDVADVDAGGVDDADDLGEAADGVGDDDRDDFVDAGGKAGVLEDLLGFVGVLGEEAEDAVLHGVSEAGGEEVDAALGKDLQDFLESAFGVFEKNRELLNEHGGTSL